jgi:hypothetical protein
MAESQKKQQKQPAAGGGRTLNTEPRQQLFSQFTGCNLQVSPREFSYEPIDTPEQTDLMMTYVVIQNNVSVTPNKTLKTRDPIKPIFTLAGNKQFTGVASLIGDHFYAATTDSSIVHGSFEDSVLSETVTLNDVDGEILNNEWSYIGYANDMLVGMTNAQEELEAQLWTDPLDHDNPSLENAKKIEDPLPLIFENLSVKTVYPVGDDKRITISATETSSNSNRISLKYARGNKYGTTVASDALTFYSNLTVDEFFYNNCVVVTKDEELDPSYRLQYIELYFTEADQQNYNFLARVDTTNAWSYTIIGYSNIDMSQALNTDRTPPTENTTIGVPASHMAQIDNRNYFWGGTKADRLWIGGGAKNPFNVSIGTEGGFCDIEPGAGNEIRVVTKWKTQSGNSIVTALCDNINSSKESRHNIVENTISLAQEQGAKGWYSEEITNTVGCKSFYGAFVFAEGLYAISRYGISLTTSTMEYNSQIRVTYVSQAIQPIFVQPDDINFKNSVMYCINDVIYFCLGKDEEHLDNVIFCYDVNVKAWWSYTLDIDEPILSMLHIDHESYQEGVGIITPNTVYLLPTTRLNLPINEKSPELKVPVLIETGELSTSIPQTARQRLTQLEFNFDYFVGDLKIECICIDQFGRKITTTKNISYENLQYNLTEYMRIDLSLQSYKLIFSGEAGFRLIDWIAKCYPLPNSVGLQWGFDDSQSYRADGDIHHTYTCYNDLKDAIIP